MTTERDDDDIIGRTALAATQIVEERFEQTNRIRDIRMANLEARIVVLRRQIMLLIAMIFLVASFLAYHYFEVSLHSCPICPEPGCPICPKPASAQVEQESELSPPDFSP